MQYNNPALDPTDPQGTDLAMDPNGDLIITPHGDIAAVSGADNIKQMVRIRLQTRSDSYIFGNDLGSDLGQTVDEPLSPAKIKLIEQYVYNALTDPRIIQINSVSATDANDGTGTTYVTVSLDAIGVGTVQTTVPIGGVTGV